MKSKSDNGDYVMKNLMAVLTLFVFIAACGDGGESDRTGIKRPVVTGVKTEEIKKTGVDEYHRASGTVKAKTISDVASRVMGTVTSITVKQGQRVARGELLLTIDDTDTAQRAAQAREGYREVSKSLEAAGQNKRLTDLTYERYRNLFDDKAISRHEMDEIETRKKIADIEYEKTLAALNRAKASFEEARINLGFTKIKAPVPGVVTGKNIEVGDMAVPGEPLLRVEDDSSYRLEVYVDEKLHGNLRVGMPVYAHIDALNRGVKGKVAEIVPAIDPGTRTFLVKIDLDSESLGTGLFARVLIPVGKKETILVPAEAIVEKGQLVGVYTVGSGGIINYRLIRRGKEYNGDIEVLSGLKEGERIIVEGSDKAIDGGVVGND